LLVTLNVIPSSPILVNLLMESDTFLGNVDSFIEDGILHSHRRENFININWLGSVTEKCLSCEVRIGFNISEDGILHSHCRENLKSYIILIGWAL
jgi:hypothetical protein